MTYGSPEEEEEYAGEEDGYEDWWQEGDPEEDWWKEDHQEEEPFQTDEEEYDPEGKDLEEEMTSYLLDNGMTDEAQIASLVQENYVAHLNWTTKTKGKSPWRFRKGKGKGKSKGKGKGKGTKPLAERKEQLAELKKRTKCKDCGKVGHWAGNKECRGKDNKTAHMAVMAPPAPEEGKERGQRKKATFCAN